MTMITLESKKRDNKNTAALRKEGMIPAVVYGPKQEPISIAVARPDFERAYRQAGETSVVMLKIEGDGEKSALIHDVQYHPVKDILVHADFYVIEKGKEVEVSIPLTFVGVAPAVKEMGGTLVKVLHELTVKGDPTKLPHEIEVDISALETLDSHIAAKDIALPEGIALVDNPDEVVASVSVAEEEPEEETEEAADISSIEVEKKGKQEEE